MSRLRLVIADGDAEYVANFEKFLFANYPQKFELFTFVSPEELSKFMDDYDSPDIFIASGEMIEKVPRLKEVGNVLFLAGDNTDCVPEGQERIEKYQHMDRFVSELIRFYTERTHSEHAMAGRKTTRIVSVYSPCGGTGKSCVAAGCSILFAGMGFKSFYLNLEYIPSTELFFHGDSKQTFSHVIFYLKGKDVNISMKIEGAKCVDEETGVHFFKSPGNALELDEMTESDVVRLINGFRACAFYDVVFIDMSSGLNQRNTEVLRNSDAILLVLAPESSMPLKLKGFKASLDFLEHKCDVKLSSRIVPVLNKINGMVGNICDYCEYDGYRPLTEIPYCARTTADIPGNCNAARSKIFMQSLSDIAGYILPGACASTHFSSGGGNVACD